MKQQQIRVIGGFWRSRRIAVLDAPGLRPTNDRNRETLFNWLSPYLQESRCLDLFAGSGILGFESLSRGAAHVTAIEKSKTVANKIHAAAKLLQVDSLGPNKFNILHRDALNWIVKATEDTTDNKPEPFDICFIDPPFQKGILAKAIELIENSSLLTDSALIYIEYERDLKPSIPDSWSLMKTKSAGQVTYSLYCRDFSCEDKNS